MPVHIRCAELRSSGDQDNVARDVAAPFVYESKFSSWVSGRLSPLLADR